MKSRLLVLSIILCVLGLAKADDASTFRYVGGDISLLPDYENANAKYKDQNGQPINDVLKFCYDEGMNCMRVRLFVNPGDYTGSDKDPNAKQDLEYIIPLCRRIQQEGFALLLDFHYSDTWADPVKQWTPKAWEGLTDSQLYNKIEEYTKETLETLKENGVVPEFIQPGNEISYGMLWGPYGTKDPQKVYTNNDANWPRFCTLLKRAIRACKEVCPEARIILHNERVAQPGSLTYFFNKMKSQGVTYDIIGLSYYPYFHGNMGVLETALNTLEQNFPDKQIMIVETGFPYAWEVPGTTQKVDYPYSEAGQLQFATDLVDTLLQHKSCTGLFWWWFEYNAYNTNLSGWYNAPLFDSRTGRVTKAMEEICSFGSGPFESGLEEIKTDCNNGEAELWYDIQGYPVSRPSTPGIYIRKYAGKTSKIFIGHPAR